MSEGAAINLALLGWDSGFQETFAAMAKAGVVPARVVSEGKHAYVVVTADGEMTGKVPGRLMHQRGSNSQLPKVGDWVGVSRLAGESKVVIEVVLPRRTQLVRKVPGRETEEQVLAANVDMGFVVLAMDQSFNERRLERFLVMVHDGGAQPVLLLNKMDLCEASDPRLALARSVAGDALIIETCALTGKGIRQIRKYLVPGRTAVFIGPSGVGKSSLINRLCGDEIQATLEVRDSDAKGRHATTSRELIQMPWGGVVIDTPGMRELHTWNVEAGVRDAFPDIDALGVRCHFRDCSHTTEKRCAVREAVERGELDSARLESYLKLRREGLEAAAQQRVRRKILQKRDTRLERGAEEARARWRNLES
jgi:ribosome biogenesis GTPase